MYARVYLEITDICNRNCSFCPGTVRPLRRMTMEEFQTAAHKIRAVTEYLYFHVMGEPLTHPLLPDFISMAKEMGFRSVLTTNGTLLHKRGEELLRAGLHKVSISLHSFEKDDENAQREYVRQTAEFADAAAKVGTLVSFRLWNRGTDDGHNDLTESCLREFLPGDWTENSRGYRIKDRIFLEWGDRFGWPDKNGEDQGDRVFCYGLRDHFGILCDGTVVPCCLDSDGVIDLGNVFTEDLTEILASPRATAMVEGFSCRKATESLCHRCPYARKFSK